jgi:hypothetical protein
LAGRKIKSCMKLGKKWEEIEKKMNVGFENRLAGDGLLGLLK